MATPYGHETHRCRKSGCFTQLGPREVATSGLCREHAMAKVVVRLARVVMSPRQSGEMPVHESFQNLVAWGNGA